MLRIFLFVITSPTSSDALTIDDGSNWKLSVLLSHQIPNTFCWFSNAGERSLAIWFSKLTEDPLLSVHTKTKSVGRAKIRLFHVEFYADNGARSWLSAKMLLPFKGAWRSFFRETNSTNMSKPTARYLSPSSKPSAPVGQRGSWPSRKPRTPPG
jgi:hypothetical protein